MKRALVIVATGTTLVVLLTACGPGEPPSGPTVVPPSGPTAPTSSPPSESTESTSGPFRNGEAIGETARDLWEASKDFGRGVLEGFQK